MDGRYDSDMVELPDDSGRRFEKVAGSEVYGADESGTLRMYNDKGNAFAGMLPLMMAGGRGNVLVTPVLGGLAVVRERTTVRKGTGSVKEPFLGAAVDRASRGRKPGRQPTRASGRTARPPHPRAAARSTTRRHDDGVRLPQGVEHLEDDPLLAPGGVGHAVDQPATSPALSPCALRSWRRATRGKAPGSSVRSPRGFQGHEVERRVDVPAEPDRHHRQAKPAAGPGRARPRPEEGAVLIGPIFDSVRPDRKTSQLGHQVVGVLGGEARGRGTSTYRPTGAALRR